MQFSKTIFPDSAIFIDYVQLKRSLVSISFQLDIRTFNSNVKKLKLKKIRSAQSLSPMAARGPEVEGGGNVCQTPVSRLANPSNDCKMVCPLLFRSRKIWKITQGLLKTHNASREQFWISQAGSCTALSLAGEFLLLISLLTFLSIYEQSLEL